MFRLLRIRNFYKTSFTKHTFKLYQTTSKLDHHARLVLTNVKNCIQQQQYPEALKFLEHFEVQNLSPNLKFQILFERFTLEVQMGHFDTAMCDAQVILDCMDSVDPSVFDDEVNFRLYSNLAELYAELSAPIEQVKKWIQMGYEKTPNEYVKWNERLGLIGFRYVNLQKWDEAIEIYKMRMEFAERVNDEEFAYEVKLRSLKDLGRCYQEKNLFKESEKCFTTAYEMYVKRNSPNTLEAASMLLKISKVNEPEKGLQYAIQARESIPPDELDTNLGNVILVDCMLRQMECLNLLNRFKEAIEFSEEFFDYAKKNDAYELEIRILTYMGHIYTRMKEFENAKKCLEKATEIVNTYGLDTLGYNTSILHQLAITYLGEGNYEKAEQTQKEVLALTIKNFKESSLQTLWMQTVLAEIYVTAKKYKDAISLSHQILDKARQVGAEKLIEIRVFSHLSKAYMGSKEWKKALQYKQLLYDAMKQRHGENHPSTVTLKKELETLQAEIKDCKTL